MWIVAYVAMLIFMLFRRSLLIPHIGVKWMEAVDSMIWIILAAINFSANSVINIVVAILCLFFAFHSAWSFHRLEMAENESNDNSGDE